MSGVLKIEIVESEAAQKKIIDSTEKCQNGRKSSSSLLAQKRFFRSK